MFFAVLAGMNVNAQEKKRCKLLLFILLERLGLIP